MCGLGWSTDNAAGKPMIDRSQINKVLKLGAFVQPPAENKRRGMFDGGVCMVCGWKNKIMCCGWAFVEEGIEISGTGPRSEDQVVRL
jgi:hypothetical protein